MILVLFLIFENSFDMKIQEYVQRNRTPFLDKTFEFITHTGDRNTFLITEVLLATCFSDYERDDAKLLLFGVLSSSLFTAGVKYLTRRKRPCCEIDDPFNSSFPSGHATGAFAFATVMSLRHKNLRIPLYLWASLVGFSRIYLNKHWTTDVIAGALVGITFGYITLNFKDRILKFRIL